MQKRLYPICLVLLAAPGALALAATDSGDSAPGMLETIPPVAGTLTIPATATTAPVDLVYTGASDAHSGLAVVELWQRTDLSGWASSGLDAVGGSDTIQYIPPGSAPANHGVYYFELVAEDALGNRSPEPSGFSGAGQGAMEYDTHAGISTWWAVE